MWDRAKPLLQHLPFLQAIENNYQGAMLAPTELLAEQHFRTFQKWFEPLGLKVVFYQAK